MDIKSVVTQKNNELCEMYNPQVNSDSVWETLSGCLVS